MVSAPEEIVGGSVSGVGASPWQVQIGVPSWGFAHWCGGSLVSDEWVVTAAHCMDGVPLNLFTVTLGEHQRSTSDGAEQARTVVEAHIHPGYGGAQRNDIALFRLSSRATLNARVSNIRPAVGGDSAGQSALASGWGDTAPGSGASDLLMEGTMPVVANASCDAAPNLSFDLDANEVCAGYLNGTTGGCHGDSGGPLTVPRAAPGPRELIGVVSWGQGYYCGTYTVYARVSSHVDWIRQHVFDAALVPVLT